MSNVSVKRPNKTRIVPMYSMRNGDIGVVVSGKPLNSYAGTIVKAIVTTVSTYEPNKITVLSLDSSNHLWSYREAGTGDGVLVEILEKGTEVTITV